MSEQSKKDSILGRILYRCFGLLGILPSWWHYFWAYIFSYVLQYVVGYRRKVVRQNLKNSFPDKSEKELKQLERKVFINLCDVGVEIIMLCGMTKRRLKHHLELKNVELFGQLHAEGHPSLYMFLGHFGNWEWYTALQGYQSDSQFNVLYRKQHGAWDYLMSRVRSKFGAELLDKNIAPKTILQRRHDTEPRSYIFVADQRPGINNTHLFVDFFHQQTAVYTGMERLARMSSAPVIYVDVDKPKRGKYVVTLQVMTMDASQYAEGELAAEFMKRLEKTILKAPECWLWSHRRWQYTADDVRKAFPDREIIYL